MKKDNREASSIWLKGNFQLHELSINLIILKPVLKITISKKSGIVWAHDVTSSRVPTCVSSKTNQLTAYLTPS